MLLGVVVFFYFFLIRPQKKQEKEAADMRNSLEIGDEIITIGGIIGQIVKIKGETVTIATGKDRTTLRFLRTAIREVTVKINAPQPEEEKGSADPIAAAPIKDESDKVPAKEEASADKTEK
jgi:preprotein translocase subunit YajC